MEASGPSPLSFPLMLIVMRSFSLVFCLAAAFVAQATVRADLEVTTADGRLLAGVIDSRTTDAVLWIRQDSEEIVLATPVGWSEIESASIDGRPVDVADLTKQSREIASETRTGFLLDYAEPLVVETKYLPMRHRVTSLEMDAVLANFDRDVEPDGYEIAIAAIDAAGHSVPVRGDLYVRLMVEWTVPRNGRYVFQDIQQWTLPVSEHDFDKNGVAVYALPWRNLEPEFDFALCNAANLNARLGVVGDGNFAATVPVPLREFNPYRDQLQIYQSSRFFTNELSRFPRQQLGGLPGFLRNSWGN